MRRAYKVIRESHVRATAFITENEAAGGDANREVGPEMTNRQSSWLVFCSLREEGTSAARKIFQRANLGRAFRKLPDKLFT